MHELMKTPGGGYEVCYVLIMGWLYNEELHDLFTLPDVLGVLKSRRMGWTEQRNVNRILVGKPALIHLGKLGKEEKIKTDLKDMGWEGVDCIGQAQDRDFCEHSNELDFIYTNQCTL
jgi:hypothetical protein